MIDFLGIGAQKAGTTWLMKMLKQHPSVAMPVIGKEVHFFDVVHGTYSREKRLLGLTRQLQAKIKRLQARGGSKKRIAYLQRLMDPGYVFTDDWYSDLFKSKRRGRKAGEITPNYCALPLNAIEHVKRLMPDTAVIYLIRDPLERALSSLRMLGMEQGTIPTDTITKTGFTSRGDYASNIPRWDHAFGSRVLYIPFGDIRTSPSSVLTAVEAHIGLEHFNDYENMGDRVNSTAQQQPLVTDELRDRVKDLIAPQYRFLSERFGTEFVARIK